MLLGGQDQIAHKSDTAHHACVCSQAYIPKGAPDTMAAAPSLLDVASYNVPLDVLEVQFHDVDQDDLRSPRHKNVQSTDSDSLSERESIIVSSSGELVVGHQYKMGHTFFARDVAWRNPTALLESIGLHGMHQIFNVLRDNMYLIVRRRTPIEVILQHLEGRALSSPAFWDGVQVYLSIFFLFNVCKLTID